MLVAIGLYRLTGATDNKYPYVYTNPDPKTVITYKDRVFVLGKEIPNDLIIDVKKSVRTAGGPNLGGIINGQSGINTTKAMKKSNKGLSFFSNS
jgi:hypothetical protein